ncbi:MAG: hypothetical protein ACI8RP_000004 [Urechidicola sp.]
MDIKNFVEMDNNDGSVKKEYEEIDGEVSWVIWWANWMR